jgi:hypothetical protein
MSKKNFELTNWYEKVPKNLILTANNPNFKIHNMTLPFRALIIGSSSSGKTSTCLNILKAFNNTFNRIVYVTKNEDEPLLNMLKLKLGKQIEIYEGINNIPKLDSFDKNINNLVIFDDLVLEKNLAPVSAFFVRGRKLNISTIFISQVYCSKNEDFKIIRKNVNYIIIKKVSSNKDLALILNEYALGIDKNDFIKIVRDINTNFNDFFMIDVNADIDKKFRHNFNVITI